MSIQKINLNAVEQASPSRDSGVISVSQNTKAKIDFYTEDSTTGFSWTDVAEVALSILLFPLTLTGCSSNPNAESGNPDSNTDTDPIDSGNGSDDTAPVDDSGDDTGGPYPPVDSDGDGIPDEEDCAANNPQLYDWVDGFKDSDEDDYVAAETNGLGESQATPVCAGDADGDGYYDTVEAGASLEAGTDCYDDLAYANPGAFQTVNGLDANCDGSLETNTDTDAVGLYGEGVNQYIGRYTAMAGGDLNADDFDDEVVGAAGAYNSSTLGNAGAVYIKNGSADFFNARGADVLSSASLSIGASMTTENFGASVAALDADGDGDKDLIVGASGFNNSGAHGRGYGDGSGSGAIMLFYSGLTAGMTSADADTTIIGDTNEVIGSTLYTSAFDMSDAGYGLGTIATTIASTSSNTIDFIPINNYGGTVNSSDIRTTRFHDDLNLENNWGSHVAMGDVNNDGYMDFVVADSIGESNGGRGQAILVYGAPEMPDNIELSELTPGRTDLQYVTLTGQAEDYGAGSAVAIADVDNDGYDDVIIGAGGEDSVTSNGGVTYVVYGAQLEAARDGGTSLDLLESGGEEVEDYNGDTKINGADVELDGDVELLGGKKIENNVAGSQLPSAITAASDTDGDGIKDVMLASSQYESEIGKAFYYSNYNLSNATTTISVEDADQSIDGTGLSHFGQYIAGGFDFNGDGAQDLLVNDPNATNASGNTNAGAVLAFAGGMLVSGT